MMATEYTPNYNLDLYASADKPNLRDQYNAAMGKIDTQMKKSADDVTNANANVLTLQTQMTEAQKDISALESTVETHGTQITDVQKTADDALSLAQTNESDIADTQNDVTTLQTKMTSVESTANKNKADIATLQTSIGGVDDDIAQLESRIAAEETARANADASLGARITAETTARQSKDVALAADIEALGVYVKRHSNVVCVGDSYGTDYSGATNMYTVLAQVSRWNVTNVSVGGSGFYIQGNGKRFINQLDDAAAQVSPADVDTLIVCGGRNDRGSVNNPVSYSTELTYVRNFLSAAKSKFPNAAIYVFPMLWDKVKLDPMGHIVIQAIETACAEANVWCARGCYSWGYNETFFNDIHPNSDGAEFYGNNIYSCIANNLNDAFKNVGIRYSNASALTGYATFDHGVYHLHGVLASGATQVLAPCFVEQEYESLWFPQVQSNGDMGAIVIEKQNGGTMKGFNTTTSVQVNVNYG